MTAKLTTTKESLNESIKRERNAKPRVSAATSTDEVEIDNFKNNKFIEQEE